MRFKGNSATICNTIAELLEILGNDATIQEAMDYLASKQVA